jgi:RNA-directed DNA polymerase
MKESHVEGLATHDGPESCGVSRKGRAEALTGVRAGRAIEPRKKLSPGCRRIRDMRKAALGASPARDASGSCAVEDPGTYGNTSHENREVLGSPVTDGGAGRVGKSKDARRR